MYAAVGTGRKLYQYKSGRAIRVVEAANLSMLLEAAAYSLPAALKTGRRGNKSCGTGTTRATWPFCGTWCS